MLRSGSLNRPTRLRTSGIIRRDQPDINQHAPAHAQVITFYTTLHAKRAAVTTCRKAKYRERDRGTVFAIYQLLLTLILQVQSVTSCRQPLTRLTHTWSCIVPPEDTSTRWPTQWHKNKPTCGLQRLAVLTHRGAWPKNTAVCAINYMIQVSNHHVSSQSPFPLSSRTVGDSFTQGGVVPADRAYRY